MSESIVILGGCGGIGRVLVNQAVKIGYDVHAVSYTHLTLPTILRV